MPVCELLFLSHAISTSFIPGLQSQPWSYWKSLELKFIILRIKPAAASQWRMPASNTLQGKPQLYLRKTLKNLII